MAHFHNPSIIGASGSQALPYNIDRSLRFNSADSTYLSRTPASAGNRRTWTFSCWVKRSKLSEYVLLLTCINVSASHYFQFVFDASDKLVVYDTSVGGSTIVIETAAQFRDVSSWYHIVLQYNTTESTAANKVKLYVNGSEITAFATDNRSSLTSDSSINRAEQHSIGSRQPYSGNYFNGYLADIYFLDGTAAPASTFGEVSATTGQWVHKTPSGVSYGTNGYHLTFSNNSGTTSTTLGKDAAGNNNWTPNNFSITNTAIYSGLASGTFDQGYYKPSNMWTGAGIGNTSNVQTAGTTSSSGSYGTSVYFDLSSKPISASSVDLWILKDNNMGSYAPKIEINGTDITPSVLTTGYSWVGVTGLSSLTSIRIPAGAYCGGIRINGTLFVEGQTTDSVVDSPNSYGTDTGAGGEVRGNYATLNPLDRSSNVTLANGNLDWSASVAPCNVRGTVPFSGGKFYCEATASIAGSYGFGIGKASSSLSGNIGAGITGVYAWRWNGAVYNFHSSGSEPWSASGSSSDVLQIAIDASNPASVKLFLGRQNTWYDSSGGTTANPATGANPTATLTDNVDWFLFTGGGNISNAISVNMGARAFAYTAPSGFKALVDTNLTAPTIAKPANYFDVKLWTGNGSTQSISGFNFSPDFAWIKSRSGAGYFHELYDTIRGATYRLFSNATNAESALANSLTSFDSTGFSLGSNDGANGSSQTYVAWAWDAASSNSTNTSGTITSTVRANATAGFSIVTYTATGSTLTVGHGLGVAPELIIIKGRTSTASWAVYTKAVGTSAFLLLNSTAAVQNYNVWNNTSPTSTVFTVGAPFDEGNTAGVNHVAYCFAPVAGYSSFGSYTGNGSSDGPFVFTGHRSRWIMIKRTDSTANWRILDTARDTYNIASAELYPSLSNAEGSFNALDINSNGFKIRNTDASYNASGGTYIYMALAENPFAYARAR